MQIVSATSAFPKHYYSQEMLFAALQQYWGDRLAKPEVLRRLHKNVGVDGRFLALPIDAYPLLKGWGEANDHWIRTALDLGYCSISRGLTEAGLRGRATSAVPVSSRATALNRACRWRRTPGSGHPGNVRRRCIH